MVDAQTGGGNTFLNPLLTVSVVAVFLGVPIMYVDMAGSSIAVTNRLVNARRTSPIAIHSLKLSSITDLWSLLDCSLYFLLLQP